MFVVSVATSRGPLPASACRDGLICSSACWLSIGCYAVFLFLSVISCSDEGGQIRSTGFIEVTSYISLDVMHVRMSGSAQPYVMFNEARQRQTERDKEIERQIEKQTNCETRRQRERRC